MNLIEITKGVQSNEFSDAAACTLWGGKMLVMGGTGGINWFNTDKVKDRKSTRLNSSH